MSYKAERAREVLDESKRHWNINDAAAGDADIFFSHFVVPLRELASEGLFEALHEHRGSYRGSTKIDRIRITGAINIEFDLREE